MESQRDDKAWFTSFRESETYRHFAQTPVAYFCAEYALASDLPTYAGGLGVLTGDLVREAGDHRFPLLAIGLYYRRTRNVPTPKENILVPVMDTAGKRIIVSVPIGERMVSAVAWKWPWEGTFVYLLSSDIPENDPRDRDITEELYTDNHEERLRQEILLGIGGYELIQALGHAPAVYHLNEGHSAFLALAMIRHEMERRQVDFPTAYEYARSHILFTNHTLVFEGQEHFFPAMIENQIGRYAAEMGVSAGDVVGLGMGKNSDMFSMTTFAFHLSTKANAVSALHAQEASEAWPEHSLEIITNGIHIPRWDKVKNEKGLGLWDSHQENKAKLLERIFRTTGEKWDKNTLLFGWARRLVEYKQPLAFLKDPERFKALATDPRHPLRIVFSGPTGEDPDSNPFVAEIRKMAASSLAGLVVFLPQYNTDLAEELVSGCDVWLNTPLIGSEACGTSGMKAALNGVLPLSTRDGWVAETDLAECGWTIDEPDVTAKLLRVTQEEIIPAYYRHLENPENSDWIRRMERSRALIKEWFSMDRVLREYIEKFYIPVLRQNHSVIDE